MSNPRPYGDMYDDNTGEKRMQIDTELMSPTEITKRIKELEAEGKRLWGLLDDVSTAGDMYKPRKDVGYFKYVDDKAEKRDGLFYSDGYTIMLKPKPPIEQEGSQ